MSKIKWLKRKIHTWNLTHDTINQLEQVVKETEELIMQNSELETLLNIAEKKNDWISIKDKPCPKDPLIKIIRWNKIHKCSVTVFYHPKYNEKMPWITGDLSHFWPEESFSPFWKPENEAPNESDQTN